MVLKYYHTIDMNTHKFATSTSPDDNGEESSADLYNHLSSAITCPYSELLGRLDCSVTNVFFRTDVDGKRIADLKRCCVANDFTAQSFLPDPLKIMIKSLVMSTTNHQA